MNLGRNSLRATAIALPLAVSTCIVLATSSFNSAIIAANQSPTYQQIQPGITTVTITSERLENSGKRFGINLGEQTFYGSGQILKNLVFRNPGFEGLSYQSIVRCQNPGQNACEDANSGASWQTDFWSNANFRFLSGKLAGRSGRLTGFSVHPARFVFANGISPNQGDYVLLAKDFPGDPTAGWWPSVEGGATFTPELKDLSPHTAGKQALRVTASQSGSAAHLVSYFDSYADGHPQQLPARSFLRMQGRYVVKFRAKAVSGESSVNVQVDRAGSKPFLQKRIALSSAWRDYAVPFDAQDSEGNTHALELRFDVAGATLLLDDVSLNASSDDLDNPTAFRAPVVHALQQFHPGVLRLMASSTQLGSSVANLLAPVEARQRSGYSAWYQKQDEIPIGIPEFLELCAYIHAEPWITLPTGMAPADAALLVRYLNSTVAPRTSTWLQEFPRIHLELGNETWNSAFQGETMEDAAGYGQHADDIFRAFRATPGFEAAKFDLVIGGQSEWPERNQSILAAAGSSYDSFAIAPYLWRSLADSADAATVLAGPMAEPELMDVYGEVHKTAAFARQARHPANLAIYEVNLHTTEGSPSQQTLDRFVPTLAGGLAVAAHMLQMRRDDGAQTQLLFNLPEFDFQRKDGKTARLWGSVVDMGPTERKRPAFEIIKLVNQVAGGVMLRTLQGGANPTWTPPAPATGQKDQFSTSDRHAVSAIQSFAFDELNSHDFGILLFNLAPSPQTILLQGLPGKVHVVQSESVSGPSASAENEDGVELTTQNETLSAAHAVKFTLQPYKVLLLRWHLD